MVTLGVILTPLFSFADTLSDLQTQLVTLQAQLAALKTSKTAPAPTSSASYCPTFPRILSFGSSGSDVTQLQKFFISQNFLAARDGTGYFGALTQAAVRKWQAQYNIVSSGTPATTGYGTVGPKTRATIIQNCGTLQTLSQSSVYPSNIISFGAPFTLAVGQLGIINGSYDDNDGVLLDSVDPLDGSATITEKLFLHVCLQSEPDITFTLTLSNLGQSTYSYYLNSVTATSADIQIEPGEGSGE